MILVGQKETIAQWVLDQIPSMGGELKAFLPWYDAIGFANEVSGGKGGVVYYNYLGHSVEALVAGEGYWLTPLNVQAIFLYPFVTLKCWRMTVFASKDNKISRRFIQKLGFKLEGNVRKGMPDGKDAIMYGMLKEECRWIKDGQFARV